MFQPTAFFRAGLKIIGMLTIIWSMTHAVTVVFAFNSIYTLSELMNHNDLMNYRLTLIFQAVYPVLLLALGVYLLKSGETIIQFAFRGSVEEQKDKEGELFMLFMKLAGLGLIIFSIPKAFQLVANIMFVSSTTLINTSAQMEFVLQNLIMTIVQLLLGVYLLRSGEVFYKIGFKNSSE
ncbi:hypothetical protein [Saccharococcus sp. Marseille-Q5394]|uniref:hypothetical protein n=1 Tax=Saccharococcus sp. Marseille-Q5394 TaxID=2972778 RepID=UPI0021C89361|nr:hypothetical protein [Saccharococcus sp. Marseille-Q5394]